MAGLETSMREALVPFQSAATPSCTQILPDYEDYLGWGWWQCWWSTYILVHVWYWGRFCMIVKLMVVMIVEMLMETIAPEFRCYLSRPTDRGTWQFWVIWNIESHWNGAILTLHIDHLGARGSRPAIFSLWLTTHRGLVNRTFMQPGWQDFHRRVSWFQDFSFWLVMSIVFGVECTWNLW